MINKETEIAIQKILKSIKENGLKSGDGLGSLDSSTQNSVSLTFLDTQALLKPDDLNRILTNYATGIFPLCVERPLQAASAKSLSLEEIQARIQSSAIFIMAAESIEDNLNTDPKLIELNMGVYGSCEVNYRPGMSISSQQLCMVIAPEHLVNYFSAAGFKRILPVVMKPIRVDTLDLSMSSIPRESYSDQSINVPDYGKALKDVFKGEKLKIFLHVTRLPCDFDCSPAPMVTPKGLLDGLSFKPHPSGNGQIFYKNYFFVGTSAEKQRKADMDALEGFGLFKFIETTTAKTQALSLIVAIKQKV
jgi:hypothetical protein